MFPTTADVVAKAAMTDKVTSGGLVVLGLVGLQVGLWATLAPRSLYDDFPGGGRAWVAADGPYNEHLVRDFGALNLALTAVVTVALVTGTPAVIRAAALAWLVYSVPHLVYHARHLEVYDTSDERPEAFRGGRRRAGVVDLPAGSPPRGAPRGRNSDQHGCRRSHVRAGG
jgi:hypothetical protein